MEAWDFDLPEVIKPRSVPKDQVARCYVCHKEFTTYRSLRTVPPNPNLIYPPTDSSKPLSVSIVPTATCGSEFCEKAEMMRQDAIFNVLVQPLREKYLQEKEARINRTRANARNRSTSEE